MVWCTQHPYLTNEHYAIAHFLRGTCAIIDAEHRDYKRAYNEYDATAKDAKKSNYLSLLMVAQLQKIALLKTAHQGLLADDRSRQHTIDQIILELTEFFPNAFSDLYWNFNDKIGQLSQRLLNPAPWSEPEIAIINQYLIADSTYMLKHFAKGRGQFMEVLFSFFQSTVLAFIHQTKQSYLDNTTREKLQTQLNDTLSSNSYLKPQDFILYLAVKKLRQCAEQLHAFKQQQPKLVKEPDIAECIAKITIFAKGLHFHTRPISQIKEIHDDIEYATQLLSICPEERTKYTSNLNKSFPFLADLSIDFNHKVYQTLDDLFDDIIATDNSIVHCVSATTGDTMLHRLATLPLMYQTDAITPRVREATKCLIASSGVRNNCHETPISILRKRTDFYGLLAIIDANPMIKIGEELDAVDTFLKKIERNPGVEGHFLLLDGPPGTGKTSTVQRHLESQGYSVLTWERGTEKDCRLGGLETRIKRFFDDAKIAAATTNKVQILFIDEIDQVTPLSKGGPTDPKFHSRDADTTLFQIEITALREHRVVIIGATNYPAQIALPMLSRAATNRIHFPLPDEAQRIKLLNFFFRAKTIDFQCITQLAKITRAYSPRELQGFVDSIKDDTVTQEMMVKYFNQYARTLTAAFKNEFPIADLFMPSFESAGDLAETFSSNRALAEQLGRLQNHTSCDPNKHTLLFGPPGSGKTTAVRIFAQTSGCVLIAIQADMNTPKDILQKLFDRAKQLSPAIIFFDEMHNIAQNGTPHGMFIQTEMDGLIENNITIIGATNYPEHFERAISDRFITKIELPRLGADALGKPIKKSLLDRVQEYATPVYVDSALANELRVSPTRLGQECEGLSLRFVNAAFAFLMGDLQRENNLAGITYLRLQDVIFSILRMKIQEGIVLRNADDMTNTAYIRQNRHSFFPDAVPEGGALAPLPSMSV